MHRPLSNSTGARGQSVALVVSRYHAEIAERLENGAREAFLEAGGDPASLRTIDAAGAWELPRVCQAALEDPSIDAAVALGCVIQGETAHFGAIVDAAAHGLMRVCLDARKPVSFGVLTCPSVEHAMERAGGRHGNKGAEAMIAAISSVVATRPRDRASAAGGRS